MIATTVAPAAIVASVAAVEIVSDKTVETFQRLFERRGVDPAEHRRRGHPGHPVARVHDDLEPAALDRREPEQVVGVRGEQVASLGDGVGLGRLEAPRRQAERHVGGERGGSREVEGDQPRQRRAATYRSRERRIPCGCYREVM